MTVANVQHREHTRPWLHTAFWRELTEDSRPDVHPRTHPSVCTGVCTPVLSVAPRTAVLRVRTAVSLSVEPLAQTCPTTRTTNCTCRSEVVAERGHELERCPGKPKPPRSARRSAGTAAHSHVRPEVRPGPLSPSVLCSRTCPCLWPRSRTSGCLRTLCCPRRRCRRTGRRVLLGGSRTRGRSCRCRTGRRHQHRDGLLGVGCHDLHHVWLSRRHNLLGQRRCRKG